MPNAAICTRWQCGICKREQRTVMDKVASLPHWQIRAPVGALSNPPEPHKNRFSPKFYFGPLSVHIGHLTVMVDQFNTGWPILRPKNRSQAEISKI